MTTENIQAACVELVNRLLSSEQFGYAVTAEVRDEARKALGRAPVEQALYLNAPPAADTHTCKCNLRTKLVGDGCNACNPEYAARVAAPTDHVRGVTEMVAEAKPITSDPLDVEVILDLAKQHFSFEQSKFQGGGTTVKGGVGSLVEFAHAVRSIANAPQQPTPADKDAIRDAALEEAAKQCLDIYSWRGAYASGCMSTNTTKACASAIRNLKSQPAPAVGADAVNAKRYLFLRGHSQKWSNDGGAIHFSFAVSRQKPNQWVIDTKSGDEMDFAIDAAIALQAGEQS